MNCPKCNRETQHGWKACPFCGLPFGEVAAQEPRPGEETDIGGVRLVYIPPGEFMMGTPSTARDRESDEGPLHRVRVTKGFYMAKYLVTQSLYESVVGQNPSFFKSGNRPVEAVTWHSATDFCEQLSKRPGAEFRLPTEAEWEYSCRAGTTTPYHFGDSKSKMSDYAWYHIPEYGTSSRGSGAYLGSPATIARGSTDSSEAPRHVTCPVGEKKPNAWGLYDMYGNVTEWCLDWYDDGYYAHSPIDDPGGPSSGTKRVVRGGLRLGYWRSPRSAIRGCLPPEHSRDFLGFRVRCAFIPRQLASDTEEPSIASTPHRRW